MTTKRYQISFKGEIRQGYNPADVKKRLAVFLKKSPQEVERMFTGQPVVIKKNVDAEFARKVAGAFEKAGAKCHIVSMDSKSETSDPVPPLLPSANRPRIVVCPFCMHEQSPGEVCVECGEPLPVPKSRPTPSNSDMSQEKIKPDVAKPNTADASSMPLVQKSSPKPAPQPVSPLKHLLPGDVLLTNIESVPGATIIEHFGLVSGSTIRAKHIGRDFMAGLKNIIGGELKGYTELLQESRSQAIERMKEQARQLGANAVINVRFSTSSVAQGAAELYAYGTAVRIE